MTLPTEALPLLGALVPAYTRPTAARFVTLLTAAILTSGRRAVANLLRTLGPLAQGHCTAYQRVLSRAPWSGLELSCALAGFLLRHVLPGGPSSWSATTRWVEGTEAHDKGPARARRKRRQPRRPDPAALLRFNRQPRPRSTPNRAALRQDAGIGVQ